MHFATVVNRKTLQHYLSCEHSRTQDGKFANWFLSPLSSEFVFMLLQVEKNVLQNLTQVLINYSLVITVTCARSTIYLVLPIACV